jgi:hypothetical protein
VPPCLPAARCHSRCASRRVGRINHQQLLFCGDPNTTEARGLLGHQRLPLLVHQVDVRLQIALELVGDAGAVGERVLAQLQVHQVDVLRQAVLAHEGDAGAVAARVVAPLHVHRLNVRCRVLFAPKAMPGQ